MTEQALCYARSEHTEKDYSVREIRLFDVIQQSIAENKYLLLQNGVGIDLIVRNSIRKYGILTIKYIKHEQDFKFLYQGG